ncbi:hypothetical protein ABK040_009343 [Willaertia magna]
MPGKVEIADTTSDEEYELRLDEFEEDEQEEEEFVRNMILDEDTVEEEDNEFNVEEEISKKSKRRSRKVSRKAKKPVPKQSEDYKNISESKSLEEASALIELANFLEQQPSENNNTNVIIEIKPNTTTMLKEKEEPPSVKKAQKKRKESTNNTSTKNSTKTKRQTKQTDVKPSTELTAPPSSPPKKKRRGRPPGSTKESKLKKSEENSQVENAKTPKNKKKRGIETSTINDTQTFVQKEESSVTTIDPKKDAEFYKSVFTRGTLDNLFLYRKLEGECPLNLQMLDNAFLHLCQQQSEIYGPDIVSQNIEKFPIMLPNNLSIFPSYLSEGFEEDIQMKDQFNTVKQTVLESLYNNSSTQYFESQPEQAAHKDSNQSCATSEGQQKQPFPCRNANALPHNQISTNSSSLIHEDVSNSNNSNEAFGYDDFVNIL